MWKWSTVWVFAGSIVSFGVAGGTAWGAISQSLVQANLPGGGISLPSVLVAAFFGGAQGFGGGFVAAVAAVTIVAIVDYRKRFNNWIRALLVGVVVAATIAGYMAWLTRYSSSITDFATYFVPALIFGLVSTLFAFWWGRQVISE